MTSYMHRFSYTFAEDTIPNVDDDDDDDDEQDDDDVDDMLK